MREARALCITGHLAAVVFTQWVGGEAGRQGATYHFLKCLSINWNPTSWPHHEDVMFTQSLQSMTDSAFGPIHP